MIRFLQASKINLRTQFYEKAIQQAVYEQALGKAEM